MRRARERADPALAPRGRGSLAQLGRPDRLCALEGTPGPLQSCGQACQGARSQRAPGGLGAGQGSSVLGPSRASHGACSRGLGGAPGWQLTPLPDARRVHWEGPCSTGHHQAGSAGRTPMLFAVLYLALGTLAAPCQPDGDHVATCQTDKCEMVDSAEICTGCKAGGVPIDGFCWPASSLPAALAGCAPGESPGVCTRCSSEGHFLFMGGCYKAGSSPGNEVCAAAEGGRCTACRTGGSVFQNRADSPALGSECILCSDASGSPGTANCETCTGPTDSAGKATCKTCRDGYFLESNECKQCGAGCSECTSSTACTLCMPGKYLKGDKSCSEVCDAKQYADPNTRECTACSESCKVCAYDDTLQQPVCSECEGAKPLLKKKIDGTAECVDADGCATVGQDGTHFRSDGDTKCIPCSDSSGSANDQGITSCEICSKEASQKPVCKACVSGFYLSGTCKACVGNCAKCGSTGSIQDCTECLPGYFLRDTQGTKECVACGDTSKNGVDGCAECTSEGAVKCTKCKPNYRQSREPAAGVTCTRVCEDEAACGGTAGACDAVVIDDAGKELRYCSFCGDSTKIPIDGKCVAAGSANGNTCSAGICTACANTYFLYMNGCYKIGQTPGQYMCTAAATGFCTAPDSKKKFFNIPDATKQEQSVLACGNPLGTVTGADGTAKAYVGVPSCTACTPPSAPSNGGMAAAKCTACEAPKKPNQDGSGCTLCAVAECKSCITDNVCEVCDGDKKPNKAGSACYACSPEGCSHCSADNRCEVCADGGKRPSLDGAQCITCNIDRCTRCSAEGVCGECEAGYAPKDGKCEPGSTGPNLSTGAIAGISVAAVVVVGGLVGFLCWWFICRGKA
ncbi:VSP [Giardia lamblia P15]|uniref:VSP n=1 Tax=Giardia intestinalis (strain P15) TaxID=658858 RepID=E1EZF7_GIAIA|nr:VSP [Giardia lamblia P15]